ncbi:MAG: outer membrane beta-barrel protein [Xanthobacteraceae bacterium]|nr:outer membrane beta-barrel protein [Xanthobacteraceae bacterium]
MKKILFAAMIASLGSASFGSASAFAADLMRPAYKAAAISPVYNWSGFYVGGQVGGASLSPMFKDPSDAFDNQGLNPDRSFGVTGGVYGGYNWQIRNFVVGLDAQWSWYGSSTVSSQPFGPGSSSLLSTTLNDAGSLKARFGLALDDTMVYVAAGPAWGNFSTHAFNAGDFETTPFDATSRKTVMGLAVAGGVEHMISPNWIVRGQVQYTEFATQNFEAAPFTSFGQQSNLLEATAGVSYKFGGN